MPCGSQINSVFCRTLSPNPPWNDQWINSAILIPRTKHTWGLAVFIIIILTVPIQMKWIPRIHPCLPLFESGHTALKRPSQTPQKQPWWMAYIQVSPDADWSASEANDRSHSRCDRDEGRREWTSRRGAGQSIHHTTVSWKCGVVMLFVFFPLFLLWFCVGLRNTIMAQF